MSDARALRVLVVNDSRTQRAALCAALRAADGVTVVAEASSGAEAVRAVSPARPDVVLMDVVMPHFDGYAATRAIMAHAPVPIVLVSSVVDPRDVSVAMEALRSGALAILEALPSPLAPDFVARRDALVRTLRAMARVSVSALVPRASRALTPALPRPAIDRATPGPAVVGIAASTGGPGALVTVLRGAPVRCAPVLLVQHIAAGFSEGFAQWLASATGRPVDLAVHGRAALEGHVYIAPGDRHLGIAADGTLELSDAPPEGLFRPSATWMLRSLARSFGDRARAAVLTGMGSDGAAGALALRQAGGRVFAQDEATSVVYGMPGETVALGAAHAVLPLDQIAAHLF